MSWRSSVAIAIPISWTLDNRFRRVPSCWMDPSWAAHVAIRSKSWAARIATLAWVARAAMVSRSSSVQACGRS